MAHFEARPQIAYLSLHHGTDVEQRAPSIPRKPVAGHARSKSQVELLQTPVPDETTSLASEDKDSNTEKRRWRIRSPPSDLWETARHLSALFGIAGLFIASVYQILRARSANLAPASICDSGGNFRLSIEDQSFWSVSGAFEISTRFGNFTFAHAKLIDIAWDMVIGRGGQAILAFISYRVFAKSLTTIMERSSVTLDTFEAIALRGSISTTSIFVLVRENFTNTTPRAKVSIAWIIIASTYVLSFQTLMSAMTGYSSKSDPYISLGSDETQLSWSSFHPVSFIIHDGDRLGLTKDYVLTDYIDDTANNVEGSCLNLWISVPGYISAFPQIPILECRVLIAMTYYVEALGSEPTNRTSTIADFLTPKNYNNTIDLEAPTLNISQYYDNQIGWSPVTNTSQVLYYQASQKNTYNSTFIKNHGVCDPEPNYQWGYSSQLLFIAVILTTIWAVGMWCMWVDAHYQSKLDLYGRRLGGFRAAVDVAQILQNEFDDTEDMDRLSDGTLRKRANAGKHRVTISYADLIAEKATRNRAMRPARWPEWRCWSWMNRHRIWTGILFALFLGVAVVLPVVLMEVHRYREQEYYQK